MPKKTTKLSRYPWDEWFKKSTFTLKKGRDYVCQTHGMSVQVRTAAAKRGLYVSIETDTDNDQLKVHAWN